MKNIRYYVMFKIFNTMDYKKKKLHFPKNKSIILFVL